ncbi:MAG TPA: hypothetical protein VF185_04040 [Patescibacteria group bacterium]
MTWIKVGKVSHYYDKIKVAIVDLDSTLAVGDKIKFVRGGEDLFEQKVDSIQIEHEQKKSAGKGECIGIKAKEEIKDGAEVFKDK